MKILLLTIMFGSAALAQIPGVIKDKLNSANSKVAPVTDRAQKAVDTFTPWTPEEEQEIGLASAQKMVAMFSLMDDAGLEKYVNLVGLTVAQFAPRPLPWRFGVLNTNMVGAFSLPGGYVFVTRGSLAGMTNEAQLAGVLGHEIEHASARHLESEIRGKKASAWATEEGMAKVKGPALLKSRADALVKDLFSTSLSRAKENDADEQGSRIAARAGYAGSGLMEFLKVASMSSDNPANKRLFGQLLSTHPPFPERISHLASLDSVRAKGKTLDARFHKAVGR